MSDEVTYDAAGSVEVITGTPNEEAPMIAGDGAGACQSGAELEKAARIAG